MGSPLRGQFIARHEGKVAWVKMLGSEGVKSLAGEVVDHTVGVRTTGQSNAFFQCHVWGGLVPPVTKGRLPEMLENSICFDLGGMMNLLRDCYADTGATGFRVDGVLQQIVGCWFLNNTKFGLKEVQNVMDHFKKDITQQKPLLLAHV